MKGHKLSRGIQQYRRIRGAKVLSWRLTEGMNQTTLGIFLGLSVVGVSRLERGGSIILTDKQVELVELLTK